jgi:hypothetical protein
MSIKILQLHKKSSYEYKFIQDKYDINYNNKTVALADGTTQSFNSENWASLLTSSFVQKPTFDIDKLIYQFKEKALEFEDEKYEYSSNPAKAKLEKDKKQHGGTSTFIGLQFIQKNVIEVIACGDSCLFVLKPNNKFISFPFEDVNKLDECKYFINTKKIIEDKVESTFFRKIKINCDVNDTLFVATDALSRLILVKPYILSQLLEIKNFDQFLDFCNNHWNMKEMQEDDISLIIIPLSNNSEIVNIVPPDTFSFPREVENDFKINNSPTNLYSDMQFNEIRNQFNGVSQDFKIVKQKQKLHDMLLGLTIFLLFLNILFVYFSHKKEIKNESKDNRNNNMKFYDNKINDLRAEIDILQKNEKNKALKYDSVIKVVEKLRNDLNKKNNSKNENHTSKNVNITNKANIKSSSITVSENKTANSGKTIETNKTNTETSVKKVQTTEESK